MTITPKRKMELGISANVLLLIIITIPILLLNNGESTYFRCGWHDDLVLISIPINTKTRYIVVCVYLMMIKTSGVLIGQIISPIIGFNIYNPDKKVITDFTKTQLQIYGNV